MASIDLFLLALRPPGNIERALIEVQQRLFRGYALVSALALRPLIPLAFLDSAPPEPHSVRQDSALTSGGWITSGGTLFLQVEPASLLRKLAAASGASDATARAAPFPCEPALYLASGEPEGTTLAALPLELGAAPELRWVTSWLECMRLTLQEMPAWWDSVSTETLWSVHLARAANP